MNFVSAHPTLQALRAPLNPRFLLPILCATVCDRVTALLHNMPFMRRTVVVKRTHINPHIYPGYPSS
jgi:hypothetical protein